MGYVHRDENMAIGSVDNVLIVGWLGPPGAASALALERTTRAIAPRYPTGIAHLNVVAKSSSATSFEEDARKRVVGMLHDKSLPLIASVTVFGGGGFVAATIRGVLASLTMLSRTPVKMRVVSTIAEAEPLILDALRAAKATVPLAGSVADEAAMLMGDARRDGFEF